MPRNERRPNAVLVVFDTLLGGTVSDGWIQHHDLATTLLDPAHVPAPQGLDGRSVVPTVTEGEPAVRDHVVTGRGHGIVVATSEWWLSIKANGKGALLYPIDQADDPAAKSVAEDRPDVVQALFDLAVREAGGRFPERILAAAERKDDAPGCSPVAALALSA